MRQTHCIRNNNGLSEIIRILLIDGIIECRHTRGTFFSELCWWAGNQKSVSLVHWIWNISLLICSCKGLEIFKSFCINSVSHSYICLTGGSAVNNLPAMQETQEMQVQSLCPEDPLKEGTATHSSILAWRIPWTEEPGGLQSMGLQRVGHDWSTNTN